jgi:hypothetical protein
VESSCEHGNEPSGSILWRIEPLLGKDLETNNETIAVDMQRRGKHTSTTIGGLCFLRGPCRGVILKTTGETQAKGYNWATLFLGDINPGT